jgi:micrococcal nuclease
VAVATAANTTKTDRAVVERVVDGDTVDVRLNGSVTRVRLLNVDTPETVDPNRPVQCLGPEASAFLTNLLPTGTPVSLEYDAERTDRYDRTLAAVFTSDGTLVNAEIARQGLAAAIVVGANNRFYPPVEQARDEAVAAGRGLFSADVACTVPAQVRTATAATDGTPTVDAQASAAQLDTGAGAASAAALAAAGLEQSLADGRLGIAWTALPPGEQQRLTGLVTAGREKAQRDESAARSAAVVAREREAAARAEEEQRQHEAEAARKAAAQAEAARKAEAQAEKAHKAEADRKAESARQAEARAEAARRSKAAQPGNGGTSADKKSGDSDSRSTGSGGSSRTSGKKDSGGSKAGSGDSGGGPVGYTGPRCYAPGGKTWKPC